MMIIKGRSIILDHRRKQKRFGDSGDEYSCRCSGGIFAPGVGANVCENEVMVRSKKFEEKDGRVIAEGPVVPGGSGLIMAQSSQWGDEIQFR